MAAAKISIHPWHTLGGNDALFRGLDAVFFSSSLTQTFEDDARRAAFRERWLDRYLTHEPDHAFVALDEAGSVQGYIVGALDDPARSPRYADIPAVAIFADLSWRYPAHLHVNVASATRGQGVGARLIETYCAHAASAGADGVHVVTGAASRNRPFYARHDFVELRRLDQNGIDLVFLGRRLSQEVGDVSADRET